MEAHREVVALKTLKEEVWELLVKMDKRMGDLEREGDWTRCRVNSLAQDLEEQVRLPHNHGF